MDNLDFSFHPSQVWRVILCHIQLHTELTNVSLCNVKREHSLRFCHETARLELIVFNGDISQRGVKNFIFCTNNGQNRDLCPGWYWEGQFVCPRSVDVYGWYCQHCCHYQFKCPECADHCLLSSPRAAQSWSLTAQSQSRPALHSWRAEDRGQPYGLRM